MDNCLEYIWIDAYGNLRSKTRIIRNQDDKMNNLYFEFNDNQKYPTTIEEANKMFPPVWTFDGSSTGQAEGHDSDILLIPVYVKPDPFRSQYTSYLVLCDTFNKDLTPHDTNYRVKCIETAEMVKDKKFLFGIEQEYVLYGRDGIPYKWISDREPGCGKQGPYYCSSGGDRTFGREIVEEHLKMCDKAGLNICGINAEVMPSQWEFQIGVLDARNVCDQLWLARYILNRVCEKYDCWANFYPKPMKGDWNGSGCHTNVSTEVMREDGGYKFIIEACEKMRKYHYEHIDVYGDHNEERLTGAHETSGIDEYDYGISHRGKSVRIPLGVVNEKKGYLEDRRPASNMNPYRVVERLMRTIALEE